MTEKTPSPNAGSSESNPDTINVRFDWSRTSQPSVAVVEAVAAVTGRDSVDGPPLYDFLDPDALDALADVRDAGTATDVCVEFVYDGVDVTITGDGTVTACPKRY